MLYILARGVLSYGNKMIHCNLKTIVFFSRKETTFRIVLILSNFSHFWISAFK